MESLNRLETSLPLSISRVLREDHLCYLWDTSLNATQCEAPILPAVSSMLLNDVSFAVESEPQT